MINTTQTIKRLYDQYKPQDFSVGNDNLNPKREMSFDKIKEIENTLQELTNELVRKKIKTPKQETKVYNVSLGSENSSGENAIRQDKLSLVGGALFDTSKELEVLIGTFPGNIDLLQSPPIIDCEPILQKYDFSTSYEAYEETSANSKESTYFITLENNSDEGEDEDDSALLDEESSDENNCVEVELEFLKLILIILKIIKILTIIVDYVISIVTTSVQVVCLAVGAWLNPPNIAQIANILLGIVTSLVTKIVSYLIQALWDLLNPDCLADQTLDTIKKIQECMNSFKSTLGLIKPDTITFIADLQKNGADDIKSTIKELLNKKGEAWEEAKKQVEDLFSSENLAKMSSKIEDEAIDSALKGLNDSSDGKASKIYDNVKSVISDAKKLSKETSEKVQKTKDALEEAKKIENGEDTESSHNSIKIMLKDTSIQNLKLE